MYAQYFPTCTSVSLINMQWDILPFVPPSTQPHHPTPLPHPFVPVLDDCTSRLPAGRRRRRRRRRKKWVDVRWVIPPPHPNLPPPPFIWLLILSQLVSLALSLSLSHLFPRLFFFPIFFLLACLTFPLPLFSCCSFFSPPFVFYVFIFLCTSLSPLFVSLLLITPL